MKKPAAGRTARRRTALWTGIGLVAAFAAFFAFWNVRSSRDEAPSASLIAEAKAALERGEYDRAEQIASSIERGDPTWVAGRLVAGEAAMRAERFDAALDHFGDVPRDGSPDSVSAAFFTAEVARHVGRLSDAERAYRYVLDEQPGHVRAHERIAFLLGITGRRWESQPHFLALLRSGTATVYHLVLLGDLERPIEQGEYLRQCAEKSPGDPLVRLGLAFQAIVEGRTGEARQWLRDIVAEVPQLVGAQAMLGELLVDSDDQTFAEWHAGLPPDAEASPDIWYVRGLWARRHNDLKTAARCFWETVRRAPAHRRGNYQLGQVLISLGDDAGHEFAARAGLLYDLTAALDIVLRSEAQDEATVRRVVELLGEMGRAWEAFAWSMRSAELYRASTWPREAVQRYGPLLSDRTPVTLDASNLALRHDYSMLPDVTALLARVAGEASPRIAANSEATIRFETEPESGIDLVYDNGADLATKGARMFEQTGGGVAVLDYDCDGWPDLHFTQGGRWLHGESQPRVLPDRIDRFYRNAEGRGFIDVTAPTGLGDPGFGQGCAAGDFNSDGFTDLYVANIGRNRLYENNGDGTFSDVTDRSGLEGETWTTSCLMADLNADGHPDLFDVTYVTGPNVYVALCDGRACSPKVFDGLPDRLFLNQGDGTFAFVPDAVPLDDSKGMGIIAADIEVRGRPSLFISNDQVQNHFLRNTPSPDGANIRLTEDSFATGLAFNEDGLPMACMGIACDDADGNGRFDFYVSNFKDESNTLYLQDAPGLFVDATNPAGLRSPSFDFVGWGTQFLDADLDGHPDLVLVNGHIDDYRDEGGKFHMRPQFFRNTGGGRFTELFADAAGTYFAKEYLGRGLARLDWNRDGRMDFAVSNIGEAATLVTNRSTGVGRYLNVRLHVRTTARDAVGSLVTVVTDQGRWTKQLVAGDGFQASNERMLQFGLGAAEAVRELTIDWPSGETTTLRDLPVDVTVELTEASSRGTLWQGTQPQSLAVD